MRCTSLRLSALLAAGVWAVHELRYRLAFGHDAADVMAAQGHGYLGELLPLVGLALALAGGQFIAQWARADAPGTSVTRSRAVLWAVLSAALLGIYGTQELLEGALAAGHPAGVAGVVGGGGWLALAAAPVVGGVLALVLRGAEAVLARRHRDCRVRFVGTATPALLDPPAPSVGRGTLLGRHLAGRAPPVGLRN